MKICSLYGAGYYYIPGTDVCMHLGGYVREEASWGYGDNMTNGPFVSTTMQNTRTDGTRDVVWRTRAYITQETRQQTAYGTLRTYLNLGVNGNNSSDFSANRAFIQIAGFTVGLASSYFDHYSVAAIAYLVDQSSDTGDGGQRVIAYTYQFGNGWSATLSAEEPEAKRAGVWNTNKGSTNFIPGSAPQSAPVTNQFTSGPQLGIAGTAQTIQDQRKSIAPDIVANLRVDGAWGSAQVMAVAHEASGGYNGSTITGQMPLNAPADTWGWAAGAGIKINMPWAGPGDYFAAQAAYTEGAVRYISNTQGGSGQASFGGGDRLGYGLWSDGVYCGGASVNGTAGNSCGAAANGINLTTAWGIAGGWEHFWTPSLRTSLHGSYAQIRYNAQANANLCNSQTSTGVLSNNGSNTISYTGAGTTGLASCNNNWSVWQIGSRTQWNITKDFYMGVDVAYYKLQTASSGAIVNYSQLAGSAQPSGLRTLQDMDAFAGRLRWHRDLP